MTDALDRLLSLRQHQQDGKRSPHKPLLVLLGLGRLVNSGRSDLPWSAAEQELAPLLAEFGRPSATSARQSAAYPFTRLRADGVWALDSDVPMDSVRSLSAAQPTGCFTPDVERSLLAAPERPFEVARSLVLSNFPESVAVDVLRAVGLDPEVVFTALPGHAVEPQRRRSSRWASAVLEAWDLACAFCGFDGQLGRGSVGLEAAHVRWFAMAGPDDLENGLALCSLHHKLFDRGALGLSDEHRILVSAAFTARTPTGRSVYDLADRRLSPRPGTVLPSTAHLAWHRTEVFRAQPVAA